MKKWLYIFLAAGSLSFANDKEDKARELCSFTHAVFMSLEEQTKGVDTKSVQRLQEYERGSNPEIAGLAEKFIVSMKEGSESKEALGEAVSSLGRLVKCSVDDEYYRSDTPYLLHKEDIQKELQVMETKLGERVPQGKDLNFHKLMIESLADQKYDLALYSYLKIAETRCQKS